MNWRKATAIFIAAVFLAIVIYDVLAIVGGGTEASISHTLTVWSYRFPAFTFFMGFIMGHLFFRIRDTKELIDISEHTRKSEAERPPND